MSYTCHNRITQHINDYNNKLIAIRQLCWLGITVSVCVCVCACVCVERDRERERDVTIRAKERGCYIKYVACDTLFHSVPNLTIGPIGVFVYKGTACVTGVPI